MSKTKILITGGAGFIGSYVVDDCINKGYEVIVIDNFSSGLRSSLNKKAIVYDLDLRNSQMLTEVIKKERPQIISHHAAMASVRRSCQTSLEDANNNIIGSLSLLEACREVSSLQKIIFASSGGAIYESKRKAATESDIVMPISQYGISKHTAEEYLRIYSKILHIQCLSLRYGNVYGERLTPSSQTRIINLVISAALNNTLLEIYGDGFQTRDYIYIEDIVTAHELSIKSSFSGVLNIGTNVATSINSLINMISKLSNKNIKVKYLPSRVEEQKYNLLNSSLALKKIGWHHTVSLKKGLQKVLKFRKLS